MYFFAFNLLHDFSRKPLRCSTKTWLGNAYLALKTVSWYLGILSCVHSALVTEHEW